MNFFNFKLLLVASIIITGSSSLMAGEPRTQYIVQFKEAQGDKGRAGVAKANAQVMRDFESRNPQVIRAPGPVINALRNNPNIAYVERDLIRYPLAQEAPYGIAMVQADLLSHIAASSKTICIIDSGINLGHEDLPNNGTITGTSDTGTGDWFTDENHHGTHVAGTIAALNNMEGVLGVLPNGDINLHIIKVFGADGWAYSSSLIAALDSCVDNGADIVSMSLGGSFKSKFEKDAFASAYANGIINVAAAGNDGNTRHSYPASYDAVISVAAIDSEKEVAAFSQQTNQVELAAPGVQVQSTVPTGTGLATSVVVSAVEYASDAMEGSVQGVESGPLVNCQTGEYDCTDAAGKICLIERGNISFADKALACQNGGGVAAIIYNNTAGALLGTLGDVVVNIPVVGVSQTDGVIMLGELGNSSTVDIGPSHYAYFDGTSMATPHVSGVAALVWSHHPSCTNEEIRLALQMTAMDLGIVGRDDATGHGLVQAKMASDEISANGCPTSSSEGGGNDGGGNGGGPDKPCRGKKCN